MVRSLQRILTAITLVLVSSLSLALANHVALEASDQDVRGTTLTLDRVTLAEDGFVVVHATDANGLVLTPPLGVRYFAAGSYEDVAIDLDPDELARYDYVNGATAVPMLHVDDGNGVYAFPDGPDTPVVVDGAPLVASVELKLLPSLATRAQTLAAGSITIDTVVADTAGFVVVHALDLEGSPVIAPPLGVASVPAGISRYVTVDLDADGLAANGYADGPKAVVPMLHVDDGDGTYEFPNGPDVPVTEDGGALVSPLELSMPFMGTASVAPGMPTLDVSADGLSVTLASVALTQPGFVVLHAANADGSLRGLPVLGASDLLPAGTHENVRIAIADDRTPLVGDTVFAMVHVDDGDGAYRFPSSDAPFVQMGEVFVQAFTLR